MFLKNTLQIVTRFLEAAIRDSENKTTFSETTNYPTLPYPANTTVVAEKRANEIQERIYFTDIGKISLQSHWGSGVKFTSATLTKK